MKILAILACLALTGCDFLTGVPAVPVPCTLARAGADTSSVLVTGASGDSVRITLGRCGP